MGIRVGTWNLLASSLATTDAFPSVPTAYLEWSHRVPKIIDAIVAAETDIIVLQEVDRFDEIKAALRERDATRFLGSSFHMFRHGKHGIAVFWNIEKFKLLRGSLVEFGEESSQHACVIDFQCTGEDWEQEKFTLVGVHLKSKISFEDVRVAQIEYVLEAVQNYDHPVIIAGDMNTFPDGKVCARLRQANFIQAHDIEGGVNIPAAEFTTRKLRNGKIYCAVSDYIFWRNGKSKGLTCIGMLERPAVSQLTKEEQEIGFPSANRPSDHLMVAMSFVFTP